MPEAFVGRGLTVRAAVPASLVAARRRRTVGGFAAASVTALATAGLASAAGDGEAVAAEHRANLVGPVLAAPAETQAAEPLPEEADALAPASEVAVDERASVVESVDAEALFSVAGQAVVVEPVVPEVVADEAAPAAEGSSAESASGESDWAPAESGDSSYADSSYADSGSGDGATASSAPSSSASGSAIISIAEQYLGTPYVWGGTTPAGFDCGGYVSYVLNQAGYNVSSSISALASLGPVTSNPKPGDLVVYGNYHIGFYAGPNSLLHAPYEGQVVRYGNMNWDSHYYISLG